MTLDPKTVIPCGVCGGSEYATICSAQEIAAQQEFLTHFHRRRLRPNAPRAALLEKASFTQDYATNIVECRQCGLLMRNPRPSDREIEAEYQEDSYGREKLDTLFQSQLTIYRPIARHLRRYVKPGAKVVEVGSFVGGFLAAGRDCNWEMLGVDPGREVADYCRSRGLDVHKGTLPELSLAPHSIDCIAIWNTFDQLADPHPTLDAVRNLLCPGGVLALRVPNGEAFRFAMSLYRNTRHTLLKPLSQIILCDMVWNNLLAFPYLAGYSVRTLDQLLAPYGLRRIAATGDTLCRLSDAETKPWAAQEERALKLLSHGVSRLERIIPKNSYTTPPWLNAYYRASVDQ